jgi:CheY-like chemotaxis protein
LNHCLNRYDSPDENLEPLRSATQSPRGIDGLIVPRSSTIPATISNDEVINVSEKEPESTIIDVPSSAPSTDPSRSESPVAEIPATDTPSTDASTTETSVTEAPVAEPNTPLAIQQRLNNHELHVLITDDNRINRKLLTTFLSKHKISYQEAENGLEALQKYQQGSVRFDVILMDISMPVLDGMSATRAIREYEKNNHIKRTYIVAMTGLASSSAKLEAWSSGVDHFMTKPVKFKELDSLLQSRQTKENNKQLREEERVAAKKDALADVSLHTQPIPQID